MLNVVALFTFLILFFRSVQLSDLSISRIYTVLVLRTVLLVPKMLNFTFQLYSTERYIMWTTGFVAFI